MCIRRSLSVYRKKFAQNVPRTKKILLLKMVVLVLVKVVKVVKVRAVQMAVIAAQRPHRVVPMDVAGAAAGAAAGAGAVRGA